MLPLSFSSIGEPVRIQAIKGKPDVMTFLESLGFVSGCAVTLLSKQGGNVIVKVKDVRVAISAEMAGNIMVAPHAA
ncbi:MAG: ferrous iron transport protein A [Actinomycetes bacterium]|jgi:ferrous iron transport protein A|nr:ferrous iron transport protein A [Actinomycetes bacterium]